ncbi:hypothetical protein LTR15_006378 [Elasticomyces elasticus]|nr:hypothetical protein LTR15_006378 [Elasticomyces elasticus]
MTKNVETGPNGPLPHEILEMYPNQSPIRRPGKVNSWDNTDFRAAVKATVKHQCTSLVSCGLTALSLTASPLTSPSYNRRNIDGRLRGVLALSLRAEGYHVAVNLDTSGTFNQKVADTALGRMQAAGVQFMNLFSINGELFRDWRSTNPSADETVPYLDHYNVLAVWHIRPICLLTLQWLHNTLFRYFCWSIRSHNPIYEGGKAFSNHSGKNLDPCNTL